MKTETIKMAQTAKGAPDGVNVREYLKGVVYDVPEDLALQFRKAGFLVLSVTGVQQYIDDNKSADKSVKGDEAIESPEDKGDTAKPQENASAGPKQTADTKPDEQGKANKPKQTGSKRAAGKTAGKG